jgi:hypothetical protein
MHPCYVAAAAPPSYMPSQLYFKLAALVAAAGSETTAVIAASAYCFCCAIA